MTKGLKPTLAVLGLQLVSPCVSAADELPLPDVYRVGGYYGDDSSYAAILSGDWAVFDASRVNLGGAYVNATGATADLTSYQLQAGIERASDAWSYGFETEYREDETTGIAFRAEDTIETLTARVSGAYQGDSARASVAVGRRRIELSLDLPRLLQQFVETKNETYSTEYALALRYSGSALSIYGNGTYYDYDDPLQSLVSRADDSRIPAAGRPLLQERLERLRAQLADLDFATVRLANNFLDYSATLGVDYTVGEQLFNLEVFHERVTGDGTTIEGVEAGWVLPFDSSDLEIRFGGVQGGDSDWLPYGSLTISFYR